MSATSIVAVVVISPMTSIKPVVAAHSQATRAIGSCASAASSTLSDIAVADLIGMPLGHRFGGKDPFFVVHKSCSFPFVGI